jgi:glycosyltransferase involved in cell wall biosynthesis
MAKSISIVIPAHNEARYIGTCLDAIARQTVMPDEVIVVDNNSTDSTVEIARSYGFVTVIHESRQGIVFARNAGFDAVQSDIIGRIDADTRLAEDWVERTLAAFDDDAVAAVTGKCYFYDTPFRQIASRSQAWMYHYVQKWIAGTQVLWGSNMAVRRSAWQRVRAVSDTAPHLDEDIMLSFALRDEPLQIVRRLDMVADVSMRRGSLGPIEVYRYLRSWPDDFAAHGMRFRSLLIWCLMPTSILGAVFIGMACYVTGYSATRRRHH